MSTLKPKSIETIFVISAFVVTLVLAGVTVFTRWGYNFAQDQVKSQLTQEKIFFPKAGSPGLKPEEFPTLQKYAGQQIDNGEKAKAYADEFIWVHMMKASGGKTYAEVSTLAQADPKDTKLAGLKATLFQGDMLRSSLLTAYAFSRFGVIAYYAQFLCAAGTLVMLGLSIWGLVHLLSKDKK